MKATDFSLPDQNGKIHKLSDYLGKWIILYFYSKDDTPGCTKETCGFRDFYQEIKKLNGVVIGISAESVTSHEKFAKKHNLNFILLSDEEKKVIKEYDAWGKKKFLGREFEGILRTTFLIDPKKEIFKKYEKVRVDVHAKQIIEDIKKLSKN
ncbi:MAG: thioredoxin-dependent thiol peroxidase [Patescibacteria group bacterium]|nr:thioredoxin-dependent thiol peroxidase [Patescibacteria group bacterium]